MIGTFRGIARKAAPLLGFAAVVGLSGCGEVDPKVSSEKVYAGKKDTRAYDGAKFGGDQKKWEAALAERNKTQNEYLRADKPK
jgi:hypothetical protein